MSAPDAPEIERSAVEAIKRAMRYRKVTRAELSRRLGVTPPFVTNVLNGNDKNMTMRTCARMLAAVGYSAEIRLRPIPDGRECSQEADQ